jgi:uncharacterized protein (TIGR03435 family)
MSESANMSNTILKLLFVALLQQFEAATIKPSEPGNVRGATYEFLPGDGLRVRNGTLKGLIETAYDLRDFQIFGGPGWVNSERYDVLARSEAVDARQDNEAIRRRLQTLLAQRFQLQLHRETKDLPEYALRVAKNGTRLIAGEPSGGPEGIERSCGEMIATRATMGSLVFVLSRQLDRPVIDDSGLLGKYKFDLKWTPDAGPCHGAAGDQPSLFTALQEQLGLKLDSIKGPVDSLAIDFAARPSEN